MNKPQLVNAIIQLLEQRFNTSALAAQQAHHAATDKESIAETKYDTFGLEASYLAHGQSQRVIECENDLKHFIAITYRDFTSEDSVGVGALVHLMDEKENAMTCFISPCAGGQSLVFEAQKVMLITPSSPLGKALMGKFIEDEDPVKIATETNDYELNNIA